MLCSTGRRKHPLGSWQADTPPLSLPPEISTNSICHWGYDTAVPGTRLRMKWKLNFAQPRCPRTPEPPPPFHPLNERDASLIPQL